MNNPLMGMMGGMGGSNMFAQIKQFAGLMGNRNPKQMVMNLMKQKGLGDAQLDEAIRQAQDIARMMGLR